MGHGLDDVVQWLMFPVGDAGTRGIQSHVKWCGPQHACHLHIGRTPLGAWQIALVRLGCVWLIFLRKIAQDWLAAHGPVLAVEEYFVKRSARVLGAVQVRRLSQSRHALPDSAVSLRQAPACDQSRNQRGERLRLAAFEKGNPRMVTLL